MRNDEKQTMSILLPYYWWEDIAKTLEMFGFKIFWSDYPEVFRRKTEIEKLVMDNDPDLAIEWRWGINDFPIRDLLKKYGRSTPVLLARNLRTPLPNDPHEIGCAGYLNVPFKLGEMLSGFYKALPDRKKPLLLKLYETNKPCSLFRIK